MAIKLIDNSIFLHIPKTGGDWVAHTLSLLDLATEENLAIHFKGAKHDNWERSLYDGRYGTGRELVAYAIQMLFSKIKGIDTIKQQQDIFRFCFVRHPLKWWESWWKHKEFTKKWNPNGTANDPDHWSPLTQLNGLGMGDFNEFMHNVLTHRPGFATELFLSYARPGIGFVGRTETLRQDLTAVLKLRKLQFDNSIIENNDKINVSPVPVDKIDWDPDIKRQTMLAELPALMLFGYLTEADCDEYNIPRSCLKCNIIHGAQQFQFQ